MLIKLLRRIHLGIYIFWVVFFFILGYPILFFAAQNPRKNFKRIATIRRIIALLSTWCSGIYFKLRAPQQIDWSRNYIICANHTSILDISALAILCKNNISFMGKIELMQNPITKMFFKTIDIPVDRNSKVSSYKAFKLAQQSLKEGHTIIIFPEGKIADEYPPKLQPFKNGPFRLAIENDIPILPVIIHDLWKILWDEGKKGSRPGLCSITVLQPIETLAFGIDRAEVLKEEVYGLFAQHLNSDLFVTNNPS